MVLVVEQIRDDFSMSTQRSPYNCIHIAMIGETYDGLEKEFKFLFDEIEI